MDRMGMPAHADGTRQGTSGLAASALIAAVLGLAMTLSTVLIQTVYIFGDLGTGQRPWFEHYAYISSHFAIASSALVLAISEVRRHRGGVAILALALASVAFNDSLLRAYFRVITQLKWGR